MGGEMTMESDEKVCPRCAETVKSAAEVCRYCGHEFIQQADANTRFKAHGPTPLDLGELAKRGEAEMRAQLSQLDIDQLKTLVRAYEMDPKGFAQKWTLKDDLIKFVVDFSGVSKSALGRTEMGASASQQKRNHPILIGCGSIIAFIVVLSVIGSAINSSKNTTSAGPPSAPEAPPTQVTAVQLAQAFNANEVAAQRAYGDQTLDVTGTVSGVVLDLFNDPVVHLEGINQFLPVQASFDKSYGEKLSTLSKGQQVTVRCTKLTSVISAPMLSDCSLP
jgi:hypothetical protein